MANNPLFDSLQPQNVPQQQPMGGDMMQNVMQKFLQFKQGFQGDPQQQVMSLLNSGRMTQEQFNQLSQMAHNLENFFPK